MEMKRAFYRLWFEYLKRSEKYRAFCERVRTDKGNCGTDFFLVYMGFNDVHAVSFNEWWEWKQGQLKEDGTDDWMEPRPVEVFSLKGPDGIAKAIHDWISYFREENGREPNAYEMKKIFVQFLRGISGGGDSLFLWVSTECSVKDIKESFEAFLDAEPIKRRFHNAKREKPRLDDLQKYLGVYDLWREKVLNRKPGDPGGWGQIVRHFEPGRKGDTEHIRRVYLAYKSKAEKIISNVEKGQFPGPY